MCLPFAFPPAWGQQEGRNFPIPTPEKNLGKEKLEGNEVIVFIIFVSCLLCLLCYLQTPNVSFLCFFSSKFFYLENPNTLQSLTTTVFAPREMDNNAAEPTPASTTILCWRLPWLESGTGESCTHGKTCPPLMNILHSLMPFQEAYYFCRSGLKATSESWMAPKISLKKKKDGTSFTKSCSEPSRRGTKQLQNPSSHKGSIGSELLENGPGSRISLKSSEHLPVKDEQVRNRWQRYARMTALPGKMEGS